MGKRRAPPTDAERLDWLEWMARDTGGLLLHADPQATGRTGLGIGYPERSLRQAIDDAMRHDIEWHSRE